MTLINNTNINRSDSTTWIIELSFWPLRIVCPLLILLCPIANWICICIFQSRIYNRSSSKWYFIFIAIFDTIYVLVTAPLIFLLTFQIYILNWNIVFCKLIVFLNYLSCQISAGLLACLSIDRLLATSCLFVYRYKCTTHLTKYVCLFVILILSIINSHYLIGYKIDSNGYCSMRHYQWYERIYSRLNVVYLLSYSIIPFTIITICNIFIVISVCQNKANMKKKYLVKKSIVSTNNQNDQPMISSPHDSVSLSCDRKEYPNGQKHQRLKTINENEIIDAHYECQSQRQTRLSGKLSLDADETVNPIESSPIPKKSSYFRERSFSNRLLSTSSSTSTSTYSQKMGVQLQITISLLSISICFIFCTLPNCISTIMIQTHNQNASVREIWQAMNYLSIVPLLITHSVNFVFYYLSSNMFRNRFKEMYIRKTNSTKHFSLKSLVKS